MSDSFTKTDVLLLPEENPLDFQEVMIIFKCKLAYIKFEDNIAVECDEIGYEEDLSILLEFFRDPARFDPKVMAFFQGEDVVSTRHISKEREEKLSMTEYELRVAKEDVEQLKSKIKQKKTSSVDTPVIREAESSCTFDTAYDENDEDMIQKEIQDLNGAILGYLKHQGLKVTAITLQEEIQTNYTEFDNPESVLHDYYRASYHYRNIEEIADIASKDRDEYQALAFALQKELKDIKEELNKTRQENNCLQKEIEILKSKNEAMTIISTNNINNDLKEKSNDNHERENIQKNHSSDILDVVSSSLPKILPNVLINNREEFIPIIVSLMKEQSKEEEKLKLCHLLFNLVKKPDLKQRKMIIDGCISLARAIGKQRITEELFPQCLKDVEHKFFERRALVAQCIGELVGYLSNSIYPSVVLALQQMCNDAHSEVRKLSLESVIKSIDYIWDFEKYALFQDILLSLICDASDIISEMTLKSLLPLISEKIKKTNYLYKHMIPDLFKKIVKVLDESPFPHATDNTINFKNKVEMRTPKDKHQKKILAMLNLFTVLLPQLRQECLEYQLQRQQDISFESNSEEFIEDDPLAEVKYSDNKNHEVDEKLSIDISIELETDFDGSPIRIVISKIIPAVILCIRKIAPVHECTKLRCKIINIIKLACGTFGEKFTLDVIRPMFIAASGITVENLLADKQYPDFYYTILESLVPNSPEARQVTYLCVLPALLVAILPKQEQLNAFMQHLLIEKSGNTWALKNSKEFLTVIQFCGHFKEIHNRMIHMFPEYIISGKAMIRQSAALLAEALVLNSTQQQLAQIIIPNITSLIQNDTDLNVQVAAINVLKSIAMHHAHDDIMIHQIQFQFKTVLSSGKHELQLVTLNALSASTTTTTIHVDFLLTEIMILLQSIENKQLSGKSSIQLQQTALTLFHIFKTLDGKEITNINTQIQLTRVMECLIKESNLLDTTHVQLLSAMLSDRANKISLMKASPPINTPTRSLSNSNRGPQSPASLNACDSFMEPSPIAIDGRSQSDASVYNLDKLNENN